jgi:hypothetical protein
VALTLKPSPISATHIKPGIGTGTTILTPLPLYPAVMGSGCCRRVRLRRTDPAALAARSTVVRIGSGWTDVLDRSLLFDAQWRRTATQIATMDGHGLAGETPLAGG